MNAEELKQKAIAAIRGGETGSYVDFLDAREVFGQAANPSTILALIAERDELLAALKDARELVDSWGAYASNYMQEKHDLAGDLDRLGAVIAKVEG